MIRRNFTIAFHHVFMITFYAVTLQKPFFTDRIKESLISLKPNTFNIKHYIHKSYLHIKVFFFLGSFEFSYVRIKKLQYLKKNYFEKFIEELDFEKLSTQAKHLRVCIL